jgi:hypothetical protein
MDMNYMIYNKDHDVLCNFVYPATITDIGAHGDYITMSDWEFIHEGYMVQEFPIGTSRLDIISFTQNYFERMIRMEKLEAV